MNWPAYRDLTQDREIPWRTRAKAMCLLLWLQEEHPEAFHRPCALKTTTIQRVLGVRRATAGDLLNTLLERGYLVDRGKLRTTHVRQVEVPFVRRPTSCIPNRTAEEAA